MRGKNLDRRATGIDSRRMLTWIVKLQGFLLFSYVGSMLGASVATPTASGHGDFEHALKRITERCDGRIGVTAVHVESGRKVSIFGNQALPLYSVVKLPLAVMVLKEVESGNLKLDQSVTVRREDVVPGSPANNERW